MATVKIQAVYPTEHREAGKFARKHIDILNELATFGTRHRIVEAPAGADVLLFVVSYSLHLGHLDPWRRCVRTHPMFKKHRDKVVVLDLDDRPLPFWAGLFNSTEKRWYDREYHRTVPYVHHRYLWDDQLEPRTNDCGERFLFSFIGNAETHPIRRQILELDDVDALIEDTSETNPWVDVDINRQWSKRYVKSIHASKFVLCPRGTGSGSVRMYETMKAGRVPVIISDAWVPPHGPDWDSCSIRVGETEVNQIPEILHRNEECHRYMGRAARSEWQRWFSKEVIFDRIVDWSMEVVARCSRGQRFRTVKTLKYILSSPYHVRRCMTRPLKGLAVEAHSKLLNVHRPGR